jgi:hypothetical protein
MRVIALLSLFFGVLAQLLLDGQTFTHAALGIICGAVAVACGLGSARRDRADATCRWEGRIMAGLGLMLGVFCIVQLPSAYRGQAKFNERSRNRQKLEQRAAPVDKRTEGAGAVMLGYSDWRSAGSHQLRLRCLGLDWLRTAAT